MAAVERQPSLSRVEMIAGDHAKVAENPGAVGGAVALAQAALASFPGPAVVMTSDGAVLAGNAASVELRQALESGQIVDGVALAVRAAREARSIVDVVSLPCNGSVKLLECTFLPAVDDLVLVLAKDVTLERNLRAALFESRQRYKDLVEISSDFAWEVGADGLFVFVSPRGVLNYPADALIGRSPTDFVIAQPDLEMPSPFLTVEAVEDAEVWMQRADGGLACLMAAAAPLVGPAGEWRGARGVCRDITNERARDAALARASNRERLLTYIVRTIRDVVDPTDMLGAAAEATARAIGAHGCQVFRCDQDRDRMTVAANFGEVGPPDPVARWLASHDHYEDRPSGRRALGSVSRYRHGVNGAVCVWRDVEQPAWGDDDRLLVDAVATQIGIAIEQMANHERILTLSRTDALTGLFNRRAFFEELGRRFQRLSRENRAASLIYCDLDNFKLVNDAHGHARGDQALLEVRELLLRHTRPADLIARLGGDEFALWLEGADEAIAVNRSKELLEAAKMLATYSGDPNLPLNMSLGVAVHDPAMAETMEDLLVRADNAMYRVKREGKGSWALAPAAVPSSASSPSDGRAP
jgi:diguanylate cyclase (GGDEF)-like protein/PAS domain S-box-containing protein